MTCARRSPMTSASGRRACCASGEANMPWMFHPFELAICGNSGTGKTTLIERLVAELSQLLRVGYAMHSSHPFHCDPPGADTDRVRAAGAGRILIANESATGGLTAEPLDFIQRRTLFDDCDCVIAEGWSESPLPRLMLVGERGEGVREP